MSSAERLFGDAVAGGRNADSADDDAHDDDVFRREHDALSGGIVWLEAHAAGIGEVAPRDANGVTVDLGFDDYQVAIAGLGAGVDADGVARVQAETAQTVVA